MAFSCVFCGSTKKPRGQEHIFPHWLSKLELPAEPTEYSVGLLNRVPRRFETKPFTTKVSSVCDSCNNGWMSKLESDARPLLTPLVLNEPHEMSSADQALVALWTTKTALVAMQALPKAERDGRASLPSAEYTALYEQRHKRTPLPFTQFWIGRDAAARPAGSVRVVPLTIEFDGASAPDRPAGYLITLRVGALLVHGVRFTTPSLYVELTSDPELPRIWPTPGQLSWPATVVDDKAVLERMMQGRALIVQHPEIRLVPFTPATELPPSDGERSMLRQPTLCGKHYIFFPAALAHQAERHGHRFAFSAACECNIAYLIMLEHDGVHFRADGDLELIERLVKELDGHEYAIEDRNTIFTYKELK
jgi:hypothetical protein